MSKLCNISIKNYSVESTPTDSSVGRTLLCIANDLSYEPRNDLSIYKKFKLESTFVENYQSKKVKYHCWYDLLAPFYGCYRF